jgi:hypothetical protein
MIFEKHLVAVSDCLDARFKGMGYDKQNSADRGELCEVFIKELLADALAGQFNVFRGGKIVDVHGNESRQMDIVLTGKNYLHLLRDKARYPIETVFGAVSVTSNLTKDKFFGVVKTETRNEMIGCAEEFMSLPIKSPQFRVYSPWVHLSDEDESRMLEDVANQWRTICPYKYGRKQAKLGERGHMCCISQIP